MGWEKRQRGGRYYTRTRRVGGPRIREYVGTGQLAELVAEYDAEDRRDRQEQHRADSERIAQADCTDALVALLCECAEGSMGAQLEAAGYHLHHRGEWRRKHGMQTQVCG